MLGGPELGLHELCNGRITVADPSPLKSATLSTLFPSPSCPLDSLGLLSSSIGTGLTFWAKGAPLIFAIVHTIRYLAARGLGLRAASFPSVGTLAYSMHTGSLNAVLPRVFFC